MSLAPYIEEGPALLMFTPRNPFFDNTPYFELVIFSHVALITALNILLKIPVEGDWPGVLQLQ
jgi:hypothetical protein